jgi:hypothetical protein
MVWNISFRLFRLPVFLHRLWTLCNILHHINPLQRLFHNDVSTLHNNRLYIFTRVLIFIIARNIFIFDRGIYALVCFVTSFHYFFPPSKEIVDPPDGHELL